MSEQLYKPGANARFLFDFTNKLINGKVSREDVLAAHVALAGSKPKDFISAVDLLVENRPVSIEMKKGINKMLNVFYTHLSGLPVPNIRDKSFSQTMVRDNKAITEHIEQLKPLIKKVQGLDPPSANIDQQLQTQIGNLSKLEQHYQIMENILFPFLEMQWPDHRCLKVLWSVHDDARAEIRALQKMLNSGNWDLKLFNRLTGDLFFNLKTIIFREEKILLPAIIDAGFDEALDSYLAEAAEIGWSFVSSRQTEKNITGTAMQEDDSMVKFATGNLSPTQIEMIFNHLPVDLTFVDETDTVQYFSTPKKRTFTRTNAVIGRKVQNCHPPESVWMVEEILEAFRKGEQEDASFWIPFGEQFVYIQYFAIRDSDNNYCGTIEVTQDVKEIRDLEGERRLLNWKKKMPDS